MSSPPDLLHRACGRRRRIGGDRDQLPRPGVYECLQELRRLDRDDRISAIMTVPLKPGLRVDARSRADRAETEPTRPSGGVALARCRTGAGAKPLWVLNPKAEADGHRPLWEADVR